MRRQGTQSDTGSTGSLPRNSASKRKKVKIFASVVAAVSAGGALLSGIGATAGSFLGRADDSERTPDTAVSCTPDAQDAESCSATAPPAPPKSGPMRADRIYEKRIRRDKSPDGTGPWPFVVLYDLDQGVWVRSGPDIDDVHVGLAQHRRTLWVDCRLRSAFNPEPALRLGPLWYRIHWPSHHPTEVPLRSQPSDPSQGYVYMYYARPSGTNGRVPAC
jgi:hypothetical protein